MKILGIDPGDVESAYVVLDTSSDAPRLEHHCKADNDDIRKSIVDCSVDVAVIEYNPPYAMRTANNHAFVPNQLAYTYIESGRFIEVLAQCNCKWKLLSRHEVKKQLLGRTSGTDANVRQAILDRYGGTRREAVGVKARPGPLYGVKADEWQAIALVLAYVQFLEEAK